MHTETGIAPIGYRATQIADSATPSAPISLHAVNGWRGIGALAIVFGHLWLVTGFIKFGDLRPIALLVDLFFVLSGLLIAHAYTEKLSRASAIPEYIVRRFGRIWPVHAAMLFALVGYETVKLVLNVRFGTQFSSQPFASDGASPVSAIWTNLLLVHSLGLHDIETWNFPSWSLSVEFATYALFAVFCLLRPFARRAASVAIVVFSVVVLALVAPIHMRSTFDYGVFRCAAGFFAGSLLHDALRHVRLPSWPLPTIVEGLSLALVVVWLISSLDTPLEFAAPIIFCIFILGFIQGRGLLSRALLTKPFQFLAELSFTIYMVHAVILTLLLAALHAYERASDVSLFVSMVNPHPIPGTRAATLQLLDPSSRSLLIAIVIGYFATVLAASYAAYRFIEIPGRVLFGSLAKGLQSLGSRGRSRIFGPRGSDGVAST